MSLDAIDLLVGEQGRVNAALEQPDFNQTIIDYQSVLDDVGFQSETVTGTMHTTQSYLYDDAGARYDFATYA